MRYENLTGIVFGQLTVIERAEDNKNSSHRIMWKCKCSCGEIIKIQAGNLKSGHTISCKNCSRKRFGESILIDLKGKTFGKLIVLEISEKKKNDYFWLCRCSCGRSDDFSVDGKKLRSGNIISCKMCGKERKIQKRIENLSGKVFGFLRVLEIDKENKSKRIHWNCFCDPELGGCGNEKSISATHLKSGDTKSCGCLKESFLAVKLKKYFKEKYNAKIEEIKFHNLETNRPLFYDIYIPYGDNPELNGIYIEVHGEQHYRFIKGWHKDENHFLYKCKLDKMKADFAKDNGTYMEIDMRKTNSFNKSRKHIEKVLEKHV